MTTTIVQDGEWHWGVEPIKGLVMMQRWHVIGHASGYTCINLVLSLEVARQLGDALNKASDIAEAQRALKGATK